jgi:uncharacterized RDD family membrane protein YckC
MKMPGPAGPSTPPPPRNPAPPPRPVPPSPKPPGKALAAFLTAYVAIVAALLISPMVALFVVFIAVSLLASPQRHRPAAVGAGTWAAVGGTASGSPAYSPKRPAVTASATG